MEGTHGNVRAALDTLGDRDAVAFSAFVKAELYDRVRSSLDGMRSELAEGMMAESLPGAPSARPTTKPIKAGDLRIVPTTAGAAKDDMSLDPNFEKEFFLKTVPYKNQEITVKQMGTGFAKPVRIYINGRRWEFFPGPTVALQAARRYIDQLVNTVKKEPEIAANMTAQIKKDLVAGVSTVAAPVDAGKPNEVADAALKHRELETGIPSGGKKPQQGAAPKAPKPPAAPKPPKPKPAKEVKPQ